MRNLNLKAITPMKSKEVKKLLKQINKQFDFKKIEFDYYFLISRKNRVYLLSRDFVNFDLANLRLSNVGLYFCTVEKDGVRMSIEGSQLIGNYATKNIVEIDDDHLDLWVAGNDLHLVEDCIGYVLIKNGTDFYGCGRNVGDKILTYIPKSRRVFI